MAPVGGRQNSRPGTDREAALHARRMGCFRFQQRRAQPADFSDLSLAAIGLGMTRKRRKTGATGLVRTKVAVQRDYLERWEKSNHSARCELPTQEIPPSQDARLRTTQPGGLRLRREVADRRETRDGRVARLVSEPRPTCSGVSRSGAGSRHLLGTSARCVTICHVHPGILKPLVCARGSNYNPAVLRGICGRLQPLPAKEPWHV
jgi:hypothetical protein